MKNLVVLSLFIFNGGLVSAQSAADFTLTDTKGIVATLFDELEYGKVVLVDFMATWCTNCNAYVPALEQIFQEYGAGEEVSIWAIDTYDNETDQQIEDYKNSLGATYRAFAKGSSVADKYNIHGIPAFIVICPDKQIVYEELGWRPETESEIRDAILSCKALGIYDDVKRDSSSHMVFPNPTNGSANLYFSIDQTESINIEIYDLLGRMHLSTLLLQSRQGMNRINLDCSALEQGLYFIKITSDTKLETIKLVVN